MENESGMFVSERYHAIAKYLEDHGRATVEELSSVLFVSTATIRRDLAAMQKLGMVQRTHGGAVHVNTADDVSIFVRLEKESLEKESTASIAQKRLPEFQSAFIDNSSSCFALAKRLDFSYKTIVTNGFQLAIELSQKKHVNVIFLGGTVRYNHYATNGGFALSMLDTFHFDVMFSGTASIRLDGAYEKSIEAMEIKKKAFERSDKKVLLANSKKFELSHPYRVAPLSEYDLVFTDASDRIIEPLKEKGIKIYNR